MRQNDFNSSPAVSALRGRIKKVNAQITAAERRYANDDGTPSPVLKKIYKYVRLATKDENSKRYKLSKNPTLQEYQRVLHAIEGAESSAYLSKQGREQMKQRAMITFASRHGNKYSDMSEKELFEMYDQFVNLKRKYNSVASRSSSFILDAIQNSYKNGKGNKDIARYVREYQEYSKKSSPPVYIETYIEKRAKGSPSFQHIEREYNKNTENISEDEYMKRFY